MEDNELFIQHSKYMVTQEDKILAATLSTNISQYITVSPPRAKAAARDIDIDVK